MSISRSERRKVDNRYSKEYFDHLRKDYEKKCRWTQDRIKNVMKLAQVKPGELILDLGCGVGTFMIECSKARAVVTGIDASDLALKVAKELFKRYGRGKAEFIKADVSFLPFENEAFDGIICADLIEHLMPDTYMRMIFECNRVLKKAGRLSIYLPNPAHLFEILRRHNLILRRDESHIHFKNSEYLKTTLQEARFDVIRSYFKPSHIPIFNLVERLLMFTPFISSLFRRRICIVARKP